MKERLTYLLLCLIASIGIVMAQTTIRVTGKVISAEDNEPVIGASVLVKGTTTGAVTDQDGTFTLNVPSTARTLTISYVGMTTREVAVSPNISVTLQPNTQDLSEVIVVAYGTTRREAKTGSVISVGNEALADLAGTSFDKMLSGKIAGVQITATSGQPGANSQIRIRGISSINAGKEPLYVVDGVPVMTGNQSYFTNTGNALAMINPNDIESITVLKDAAATSVYGSRAANGVILVTTKTGKAGRNLFNVRTKFGVSTLANDNNYGVMNRDELLSFRRQAAINAGFDPSQEGSRYSYPSSMDALPETDWVDHMIRPGNQQEYEISATGGSQQTSYFSSLSYHKNEGIAYGITFERMQARLNIDHELSPYLKTGARINTGYLYSEDVSMQSLYFVNPLFAGMTIQPWTKPYNEDGTHNVNIAENSNTNPRATAIYDEQWEKQYRFNGSIYFQWTPLKGLVFRTTNAAEMTFSEGRRFWAAETNQGTATLQSSDEKRRLLTTSNTASYDGTIAGTHTYRVLAGQEAMHYLRDGNYVMAPNVDPGIPYPNTAPVADVTVDYYYYAKSLLSYFGILDYNYAGRYFLQGSVRSDGSSLLGKNNVWGNFYSVGASWNAHSESFLSDVNWIDLLKLRLSYGVTGNNDITGVYDDTYYKQYGVYAPTQYNGSAGFRPSTPSNDYLSWEQNASWDAGIDFGFQKRFTGSIDLYTRKTVDMLLNRPLSQTSGFSEQTQNVGSVRNQGIEIQFDAAIVNGKDWKWNAGFNLAHNKSEILDLDGDDMIDNADYTILKHIKGNSLFTFYLRDYYGVNPINGDALFVNADGKLTNDYNQARYIEAGSPEPKLTGGLHTDVSWKGLSLNILLEGKFGNNILISENRYLQSDGNQMSMNQSKSALNYWKKPGDTGVNPKPVAGIASNSYSSQTTRFLERGDYVRLKDVTLAYTLPSKWLQPAGLKNLRLYISGFNLYTFHDVNFWDPERGEAGIGSGIYPMTKSLIFGLDLSF
ncbi:MAG: TonB-dependent receptor [Tannerellaceae bacterium]|jgi:TonB-linked SusC/RagA family outer membrane protein|nr:TonB-dependent receptor [Tannerellaceae bacterium]